MHRIGLVIGKFYPPHRGHKFLIDFARSRVDSLTVVVCDHPAQEIPAETRAAWLREIHPGLTVVVTPDDLPDEPGPWAERCREILGRRPDVVFTSEEYGDEFARRLGCQHVLVDWARRTVPCSGTAIRCDPVAHLEHLEPCVRAHFVPRVCVLGAESTGTTTLARALADAFGTCWVPEYGREYSIEKMDRADAAVWRTDEFVRIAREQNRREDLAAREASRVLICDTDAFATALWHERYMGHMSPAVVAAAQGRRMDLYLLTDVNIPFVQDGYRDGEHIRHAMHQRFLDELQRQNKPYRLLSGAHEARLAQAIGAIEAVLAPQAPATEEP
jgi:NadR type nicotinamide-nucleotide adenylyltransferase